MKIIVKHHLPFGKYKGSRWTTIINKDIRYITWFIETMEVSMPSYVFNHLINRIRNPRSTVLPKDYSGTRNLRFLKRRIKN